MPTRASNCILILLVLVSFVVTDDSDDEGADDRPEPPAVIRVHQA